MSVVEGDPDGVEPEGRKERCVLVGEEVLQEPVKKEVVLLLPDRLLELSSHALLMTCRNASQPLQPSQEVRRRDLPG